jgi:hypothetical protein
MFFMTKPIKLSCLYKVLASYHSDTSLYSCFNKLTRLNTNSHNVPSSVKSWFWLILFFVFYDKTDKVVLLQMSKALCIVVFLMVVTLTAKRARCVHLSLWQPWLTNWRRWLTIMSLTTIVALVVSVRVVLMLIMSLTAIVALVVSVRVFLRTLKTCWK